MDDWLPQAENLVQEWSSKNSDEVTFRGTFEIILAALLLEDDLLPASARVAFAKRMLSTINEAESNQLRLESLYIHPPKPGRKKSDTEFVVRFHEIRKLTYEGISLTEAYKAVAEKYFKSPDTIRREYERFRKKCSATGKNDQ